MSDAISDEGRARVEVWERECARHVQGTVDLDGAWSSC